MPDQGVHRLIVGELAARCSHHHRVYNHRNSRKRRKTRCYSQQRLTVSHHADLDTSGPEVGHHDVDLSLHHVGRNHRDGPHTHRVLGRDRRHHRGGIAPECRDGLDIGLNAGPASTVRTGYREHGHIVPAHECFSSAMIRSATFLPDSSIPPKIGPIRGVPPTALDAMPHTHNPG